MSDSEEISSFSDSELEELMKEEDDDIVDIQKTMETLYAEFPPEPLEKEEKILFYLFYAAQYVIFYYINNGNLTPPNSNDSMNVLRQKATGIHFYSIWTKFEEIIDILGSRLYDVIEMGIRKRAPKHPLLHFLGELNNHKELHSRRIKGNPALQRTRQEIQRVADPKESVKNIVTDESYDPKNPNHAQWKWLIINPLPSDYDPSTLDPAEGDTNYRMNYLAAELNGTVKTKAPYCVIVTNEFDKLLRLLHNMLFFEDYLNNYIVGAITEEQQIAIEGMESWEEVWHHLLGDEFHDKPIQKMSREKKTNPLIVSRLAELRDLFRTVMDITK